MDADQSRYTTINRELGEWIKRLRCQWMSRNPNEWGRPHRFFYGFTGGVTVFGVWMFLPDRLLVVGQGGLWEVFLVMLYVFLPPLWIAWLVSWKDFRYGPVRLYLSGIFLSMLVLYIISNVAGMF